MLDETLAIDKVEIETVEEIVCINDILQSVVKWITSLGQNPRFFKV